MVANAEMDMDSEFMDRMEELIVERVEKARELMQQTLVRRVTEVQEEFRKAMDLFKKDVISQNSETTVMMTTIKQEQDAVMSKIR
jgi:DNA-binding protein H-NS